MKRLGVPLDTIDIFDVPGALEIPLHAKRLALSGRYAAIVGAALVAIGNVLPRARPNWWFGIRTPWTLSNDRVWERTHRIGGYVLMAVGALAILASIAGVTIASAAVGVAAAALGLGLIVYSYLAWRQETSR
jgi:uncharacterized membrane protein